jgi:hypothetical protein
MGSIGRLSARHGTKKEVYIPASSKRLVLLFDLDETLVHTGMPLNKSEFSVRVLSELIGCNVRPHLAYCLEQCEKMGF